MTIRNRLLKAHPATMVLAGFLSAILMGALMLKLPLSTHGGSLPFMDALFTATSAVCVTGLVVVDTGSFFTTFGQGVILALIEIGGLGVMTISVLLFQWIGVGISMRQRMAMQDLFAHTPRKDILSLTKSVVILTLTAEALGTILLTLCFYKEFPFQRAIFLALFHSVSAFCNAGFGLFPDNLMRYNDDVLLNTVICSLIVVGGIGFPVLYDLQSWFLRRCRGATARLSIQTKVVLLISLLLIIGGALMFAWLEHSFQPGPPLLHGLLTALFQSISCRTAGFNTVDIAALREATLALMIFLMLVGASPGSCGGGLKTTTLAILFGFSVSRLAGKRRVNMFKKSIPAETITRSISLVMISMGIIVTTLFMLLIGDTFQPAAISRPYGAFLPYLFETVSAFGTVGLSMGATAWLGTWGKSWIIFMMIIGRVGVLTFAYIIAGAGALRGIEYSEENLMIG